MKKIIKNKIILIVILCIISCGIGVYAATTYKATDVIYNASDGTSMSVNEALNDLYKNLGTASNLVKASNNEIPAGVTKAYVFVERLTKYNYQDVSIAGSIVGLFKCIEYENIYITDYAAASITIYELQLSGYKGTINVTFSGGSSGSVSHYSIYYLN